MKRMAWVVALVCAAPSLMAQVAATESDYFEAGLFADYFDLSRMGPHMSFVGVGARAGVNMGCRMPFDADLSYDFKRILTNAFSNVFRPALATTRQSPLHGLV